MVCLRVTVELRLGGIELRLGLEFFVEDDLLGLESLLDLELGLHDDRFLFLLLVLRGRLVLDLYLNDD